MKKLTKIAFSIMLVAGFIGFGSTAILSASDSGDNSQYSSERFTATIDEIKIDVRPSYFTFIEIHDLL